MTMNKAYADSGSDITYKDFRRWVQYLFCFDLTADGCGNSGTHFELMRQGNLRFKMHFGSTDSDNQHHGLQRVRVGARSDS